MDIDWSKAPEGATHARAVVDGTVDFYKRARDGVWVYWTPSNKWAIALGTDESWCEARPADWNGEGLPPVGTLCIFNTSLIDDEDWHKLLPRKEDIEVNILAHAEQPTCKVAVFSFNVQGGIQVELAVAELFKPIRTAEQIAAEERESECEAMLKIACYRDPDPDVFTTIGFLYDAGYRKVEAAK